MEYEKVTVKIPREHSHQTFRGIIIERTTRGAFVLFEPMDLDGVAITCNRPEWFPNSFIRGLQSPLGASNSDPKREKPRSKYRLVNRPRFNLEEE